MRPTPSVQAEFKVRDAGEIVCKFAGIILAITTLTHKFFLPKIFLG
jgi:hypothetical protein